jgi:hypothetical protein
VEGKKNGYSFARIQGEESLLVVLNTGDTRQDFHLPVEKLGWKGGQIVRDELSGEDFIVSDSGLDLSIDPWKGYWLA